MNRLYIFVVALSGFCHGAEVFAQAYPVRGEYIESTSPLSDGGTVTTRSEPGRKVQTTITVASLPDRNRAEAGGQSSSAAASTLPREIISAGNASTASGPKAPSNGQANRYPYPARYPANPGVARNQSPFARMAAAQRTFSGPFHAGAANISTPANVSRVQYPNNCNCGPVFGGRSLGGGGGLNLTPPPNYGLAPGATGQNYGYVPGQPVVNGGVAGTTFQPVLSVPPNQGYAAPPGVVGFPAGSLQAGSSYQTWNQSQWQTGQSGPYRPLFQLVNPQGAFLGRGIVGQPEAYVTGQPVINFFRYVLPF